MDITIMGLPDLVWIGGVACIACLAFGLYMVITKKPGLVNGTKAASDYKDAEQYAVKGGRLILFLAGGCFVMTILSFFNTIVSNIFGLAAFFVFAYFWKKMSDKYGPA